jgi:hypothetical protein
VDSGKRYRGSIGIAINFFNGCQFLRQPFFVPIAHRA